MDHNEFEENIAFEKQTQHTPDECPVVGRITFVSGECLNFTDPQKYLQTVREELPYCAVTGFRCETLTGNPAIRKAVDDLIWDHYGMENPHALEEYEDS